HHIWSLPFGASIGGGLMAAQIAGGIGMEFPRTARFASIVLWAVYFCFSLACIPGILAAPTVYAQYGSFFEQFSLVCGSIALYAATETNGVRALALGKLARLGLGVCVLSFTVSQIIYFGFTATLVPRWLPPSQKFWAMFTTVAFALAAIAILVNRPARLAMGLLTLMLGLF